jgi:uncharacterized iron-regulated membrane protein
LTFKAHKWLGLFSGFFLLIYGISGSVLVYKDQLEQFFYQKPIQSSQKSLNLDVIYKIITEKYPNLDGFAWVNPNASPNIPYHFRLYLNDARLISYDLGALTMNQYTGEVLRHGRGDDLEVGWIEWIFQLHFSLHLGMPGTAFSSIVALIMLLSMFTGALIFRKKLFKTLLFKEKFRTKNGIVIMSGLHRYVGVWSLVLNSIVFFSGFWMNLFSFYPQTWKNETIPTPLNHTPKGSFQEMFLEARHLKPDFEFSYIYFPTQKDKKFKIRGKTHHESNLFSSANSMVFDPETQQFLEVKSWQNSSFSEKFDALMFSLHSGSFGGNFLKIIYILLGLTPAFLTVSGYFLWIKR